jgi:hypothetical protein
LPALEPLIAGTSASPTRTNGAPPTVPSSEVQVLPPSVEACT